MSIVVTTVVSSVKFPRVRSLDLLFLLYINDLPNVSNIVDTILFADEENLFFSHKDQNYLVETNNREMHKLNECFRCSKLSLNAKK